MHCNKCNICNCSCSRLASKTIINSDQAGQDGLSAYDIAVRTGKFTGSEAEFVEWNRGEPGPPGPPGEDGAIGEQAWTLTEW